MSKDLLPLVKEENLQASKDEAEFSKLGNTVLYILDEIYHPGAEKIEHTEGLKEKKMHLSRLRVEHHLLDG